MTPVMYLFVPFCTSDGNLVWPKRVFLYWEAKLVITSDLRVYLVV